MHAFVYVYESMTLCTYCAYVLYVRTTYTYILYVRTVCTYIPRHTMWSENLLYPFHSSALQGFRHFLSLWLANYHFLCQHTKKVDFKVFVLSRVCVFRMGGMYII